MKSQVKFIGAPLLALLVVVGAVDSVKAQPVWLSPTPDPGISVEVLKPKFEETQFESISILSSVWFLSARIRMDRTFHALWELPIAGFDGEYYNYYYGYYPGPISWPIDGETAVGNPYIGLEVMDRREMWYGRFGVRLPIIGDDNYYAREYGIVADVDRAEAFSDDLTPLMIRFGIRSPRGSNLAVHAWAGPTFWLYGGNYTGDNETLIDYGIQMWVVSDVARIAGGITGRYIISLEDADFGESSVHQFGFAANVGRGSIRPGVHFRVPLDEDWDFTGVDFIYGINLSWLIGGKNDDAGW